jgi:polysaccharide export outer membrane protein
VLVGLAIALAGCAKTPPPPSAVASATIAEGDTDLPEAVDATSTSMMEGEKGSAAAGQQSGFLAAVSRHMVSSSLDDGNEYRIAPQDVLEVTVFRVPDLSKTVPVSGSGRISMPLIGEVQAAGLTVAELETDIAAKLAADYLQSPDVSVFVKDAVSQRVTVEGAVNSPGVYPTDGATTLLRVVALAGGLDRIADTRGVVFFRTIAGTRQAAKIDNPAIRAGTAADPPIVGGDLVVVDESGAKAAMRNVRESISLFGFFVPFI